MKTLVHAQGRKRPVNLTLNAELVDEARALSGNLSAAVEAMLTEYVARERSKQAQERLSAAAACRTWNAVLQVHGGSFADEHSPL